jgi:hypothetical protein
MKVTFENNQRIMRENMLRKLEQLVPATGARDSLAVFRGAQHRDNPEGDTAQ